MRVGIVGSGYEAVVLLKLLDLQGHQVDLFLDWAHRPRGVKDSDFVAKRMDYAVNYLVNQGVDKIIVPALYENLFPSAPIVPLFADYLSTYVLPGSRVGKLGIMTTWSDQGIAQETVKKLLADYTLTDYQTRTKSFIREFALWTKELTHWQFQLPFLGRRDRIMRNLVKHDLRYFKDAGVDTLIPTDRSLLYREKQIVHRMGAKTRFHGTHALQQLLVAQLPAEKKAKASTCTVHVTATPDYVVHSKPRQRLLDQGTTRKIEIVPVAVQK